MRKRPLCIATICYIIGIIMGLYLQICIVFLLCLIIISSIYIYYIFRKKTIYIFALIIFIGFFAIIIIDNDYAKNYKTLKVQEENNIKAIIISNPTEKEYKRVYKVRIVSINGNTKHMGKVWILNVKKSKKVNKENEKNLQFGDEIIFKGTIEIPSKARNYMGFDYQQYLKSQKIYGTITTNQEVNITNKNQTNFLERICNDIRNSMKEKIYQLLPNNAKELCIGILIGERQDISEEMNEYFKESNLTHMLAVSGGHISYIILGLSLLLGKTRYKFRKIFIILFLIFFMGLTGCTPSVQRASLMGIFVLVSDLLHKNQDIYTSLCFSCLIILLCNPYAILDIGFQLSYIGTFGIILLHNKISDWLKQKVLFLVRKNNSNDGEKKYRIFKRIIIYVLDAIIITVSANLMIIPIMMFQFNTISLTFWISNLLAGPILGIITMMGFVLYIVSLLSMTLANIIAFPLKYFLLLLIAIAKYCSQIPFSSIVVRTPYIFELVFYYIILFIIYYRPHFKKVLYKLICLALIFMCLFYTSLSIIRHNKLKIYFIDVGQGDSTLICTPNRKKILIDGGGSEMGSFDIGEKTLLPYLLDRKITNIDYIIISHFDTDHVEGILYLLQYIRIQNIIISKQGELCENYIQFKKLVKEKNISVIIVKQGDKIQIDKDIYFDILLPEDDLISNNILNNNSIVAKLSYGNFTMLFTGDIEAIAENRLIDKYKNTNVLRSTTLKVAHHGSKSSSTKEFLKLVSPKIALIGVGSKNTFGHPNEGVTKRLKEIR